MLRQIAEHIEHLRFDRDHRPATSNLEPIEV
jgi:hypothetical protein